jgi:hypothetical protein
MNLSDERLLDVIMINFMYVMNISLQLIKYSRYISFYDYLRE